MDPSAGVGLFVCLAGEGRRGVKEGRRGVKEGRGGVKEGRGGGEGKEG